MIKLEKTEVVGWEHVIRGMRNPKNSWDRTDSEFQPCAFGNPAKLGPNDLDLMTRLRNAGTDHRKFMRMIIVYVDITAPLYWWKEFDTYKVGTVANSCSTMHKIQDKEFTLDDFSCEHLLNYDSMSWGDTVPTALLHNIIDVLNQYRHEFNNLDAEIKNMKNVDPDKLKGLKELRKKYWWQMIQLLPSSYNQKRTVMLNYEVLANMYKSRKGHKLDEWRAFCKWVEGLPYSELITGKEVSNA